MKSISSFQSWQKENENITAVAESILKNNKKKNANTQAEKHPSKL